MNVKAKSVDFSLSIEIWLEIWEKGEIKEYSKLKLSYYNLSFLHVVNWKKVIIFSFAFILRGVVEGMTDVLNFDSKQSTKSCFYIFENVTYHIYLVSYLTGLSPQPSSNCKSNSKQFFVFSRILARHRKTWFQ